MRPLILLLLLIVTVAVAKIRKLDPHERFVVQPMPPHHCGDNPDAKWCKELCEKNKKSILCNTKLDYEEMLCVEEQINCARNSLYCKKYPKKRGCRSLTSDEVLHHILYCNRGRNPKYCDPVTPTDEEFLRMEEEQNKKNRAFNRF